ncbi:hypothetical protein [Pyrobaculum sp.]|uniref:hypothetical protein n=1 Tax=Pyrobaculum sp. TaxID=2004705 RepID=UPI00317F4AA7
MVRLGWWADGEAQLERLPGAEALLPAVGWPFALAYLDREVYLAFYQALGLGRFKYADQFVWWGASYTPRRSPSTSPRLSSRWLAYSSFGLLRAIGRWGASEMSLQLPQSPAPSILRPAAVED